MVLFLFGHLRDFYRKKIYGGRAVKKGAEGYAPIRQDYEVRLAAVLLLRLAGLVDARSSLACCSSVACS